METTHNRFYKSPSPEFYQRMMSEKEPLLGCLVNNFPSSAGKIHTLDQDK